MQLESMTPAHGTLSVLGKASKDLTRNSVLHCDIQESSCCQRTLCLYTCRRHGASWTASSWGTHGAWVPQNGYRRRQQGIHAWATHGYSSDNTPWNYDMYRNDSTQGLSWFHSQKAFPYDSYNVFHCCYKMVNCTFQIEVQQTATFFMVSNLWKTPQVCPAAGARSPKERYQQYKKGAPFCGTPQD